MIIDMNAYLGHWPFRQLRHNTAGALIDLMDEKNIDKSCVSSIDAIFYKNSQSGNEQLQAEIAQYRDRLIPFAVINPAYVGWESDLRVCAEEFGFSGLRLYPNYHNYTLLDSCSHQLIDAATELGLLISIPIRQVDKRQQHWLVGIDDVRLEDIAELVKAHPDAEFVLLNGLGYTSSTLGNADNGLPNNYHIEISRLPVLCLGAEMTVLLDTLGDERLVFGTGIPFKYADPSFVRMEMLDVQQSVKDKILSANAMRILRSSKDMGS